MSDEFAVILKVGNGMAEEINLALADGEFEGLQFEAERSYADFKDEELDELCGLKVDVVPVGHQKAELEDRDTDMYLCVWDIAIRKKFGEQDKSQSGRIRIAEIDRLVKFVEELHQFFVAEDDDDGTTIGRRLRSFADARWFESNIRQTYSRRHLRDMRMFLGIVRVSYEVSVPL